MAEVKIQADDVTDAVRRSLPNRHRPRLRTEAEDRLAPVEQNDAAKYAGMETFTQKFNRLADVMDEEHLAAVQAADLEAIPEDGEWEDSMVMNISDTRAALVKK